MIEQLAVRKSIVVNRPVEVCFKVFTEEISSWWPLHEGFSFGGGKAKDIFVEGFVGGRVYERFIDGEEYTVGEVLEYEPPSMLAFSWNHTGVERPTRVEVRFAPRARAPGSIWCTTGGRTPGFWRRPRATTADGTSCCRSTRPS